MLNLQNIFILISFLAILPTTLAQDSDSQQLPRLTTAQIWGFGVLAGIGVSAIGFFAALVLLIAKKCCSITTFQTLVKFLFSLSCGALIGDSVIHILAEAYQQQEINDKLVSLVFIVSIFAFLIFDRMLHAVGIAHSHWVGDKCEGDRQNHGHHHHNISDNNHNHQIKIQDIQEDSTPRKKGNRGQDQLENERNIGRKTSDKKIKNEYVASSETKVKRNESPDKKEAMILSAEKIKEETKELKQSQSQQDQKQKKCCHSFSGKDSAGYINIVGSLIHNFIDGLALGVAFATGKPTEIVPVLVAIIAHEIPRQLGDVAVLLRSSFTEVQAMLCNGVVNFVSLIGVFIGLAVVNLSEVAQTYIMVFVAGNFIYIASDIWQHILKNKGQSAKCGNILQFFGFCVGIGSMFALTLMEHQHQQ